MAEKLLNDQGGEGTPSALAQSKEMAAKLSVTARKLRFSTSNNSKLFKAVKLRPRLSERIFRILSILATIICFVLPNIVSVAYYSFFATDQYQSETRFTVRSSTPALGRDQLAKVSGIPAAKIVQDTQIVTNFIVSREMLDILDARVGLRKLYSAPEIDAWARLDPEATYEEVMEYWEDMVSTGISPSSGIVTVKVKAFSPEDAQRILQVVVEASEKAVNDVNERIWRDVISTAQANLDNAAAQLQSARENLQTSRNQSGVLDVSAASTVISALVSNVRSEIMTLRQRYDSQLGTVSLEAPQMRVLMREIESKEKQLADLNAQVAGSGNIEGGNLAQIARGMSQLELEQSVAEQQFSASVRTLEQVQFVSRQQLLYLDAFLAPILPERAEYPKRGFWIGAIAAISLMLWGSMLGLLAYARTQIMN